MRISDDDWRRAVTALLGRFGRRYAGIRVDGTSHPPYHLHVRLAGDEDGDVAEVQRLLSTTLPVITEPDLRWSVRRVRFGLAHLEETLHVVDQRVRPRVVEEDVTSYYIDQDRNTVVLMVPDPGRVPAALVADLAPHLDDGSVTILEGTYEPLTQERTR